MATLADHLRGLDVGVAPKGTLLDLCARLREAAEDLAEDYEKACEVAGCPVTPELREVRAILLDLERLETREKGAPK